MIREMTAALVRPLAHLAWELRTAWASGRRVALTLAADVSRVEGHVSTVAPTNAYAVVAGLHVPLEAILAVHLPSRLGDSTVGPSEGWSGRRMAPARDPNQLMFDHLEDV